MRRARHSRASGAPRPPPPAEPVASGPAAALMAAIEPPPPPPAAVVATPAPVDSVPGAVSLQQLTQPMLFNHVQTPGSARVTHRMRAYGDGIAVLFVRVRDDDDRLVTRAERSEREQRIAANQFDSDAPLSADEVRAAVDGVLEQVRVELDTNVEAAPDDWDEDSSATTHRCSATCERHWLCFDIWQRGHVNTEALVRGVVDHVRRALNAFVLETYLLCARPRLCSPFWVRSVQRLTLHAVDLGSEAFTDVDLPLALASHAVVPFARDVAARIPDIVPALQAMIYRMPGVAAGGAPLDELQPLRALDPLELGRWRAEPWRDTNEAPRLLVATMLAERGALAGNAPADEPMMYDSVKLTAVDATASRAAVPPAPVRDGVRVARPHSHCNIQLARRPQRRAARGGRRAGALGRRAPCTALDSILLQKMGLTHAIRSELLADQVDIDAPVPSLEPMLFGSCAATGTARRQRRRRRCRRLTTVAQA
jgi:hypothetical protein